MARRGAARSGGASWGAAAWGMALLAGLALAGCEDPAPRRAEAPAPPGAALAPTPGGPQGRPGLALQAAEDRLRARLRVEGPLTLRAVQAHRQAMPDTLAICGQVNPAGRAGEPFLPWVAVVTFAGTTPTRTEFYLAASSQEATRVYFEMVDRCFDGGGPASARQDIRPLPPAPSGLPPLSAANPAPIATPMVAPVANQIGNPAPKPVVETASAASVAASVATSGAAAGAPPAPATLPSGPAQAIGTITTRQPANMRANPSSGAEVVRVVPRASTLLVLREAPGGWLEVGDGGEAWGWVHNSLVER